MQRGPGYGTVQPTGSSSGANPTSQLLQALRNAKLHRNPRVMGVLFLWLFGLYAVFLSPAPVGITDDAMARFDERIRILGETEKPKQVAEQRWMREEAAVRDAKTWFWWFRPDDRARVNERKVKAEAARKVYAALEKEAAAKYSDAKAELGLWSTAGVQESRRLFWRSFESGKVFGRRQTFWDALITLLSSREEGMLGMLVQLIFRAMINFTIGMVSSVFVFVFQLPSLLWSYQPNFISGLAFFVVAVLGAISVIAGFLLALFGAGATAVYSIATISPGLRIGAGRRRRNPNLHYHYH